MPQMSSGGAVWYRPGTHDPEQYPEIENRKMFSISGYQEAQLLWFIGVSATIVMGAGEEGSMRLDFKIAVLKSGLHQFEVAQAAGLSEGRLSRFIRGREQLRPEEEQRLRMVLGLSIEREEVAHAG